MKNRHASTVVPSWIYFRPNSHSIRLNNSFFGQSTVYRQDYGHSKWLKAGIYQQLSFCRLTFGSNWSIHLYTIFSIAVKQIGKVRIDLSWFTVENGVYNKTFKRDCYLLCIHLAKYFSIKFILNFVSVAVQQKGKGRANLKCWQLSICNKTFKRDCYLFCVHLAKCFSIRIIIIIVLLYSKAVKVELTLDGWQLKIMFLNRH